MRYGPRSPEHGSSITDTYISVPTEKRKALDERLNQLLATGAQTGDHIVPMWVSDPEYSQIAYLMEAAMLALLLKYAAQRDTHAQPITIIDVAMDVVAETGAPVSIAVPVSFLYDRERGVFRPDEETCRDIGGPQPAIFAHLYGQLQDMCEAPLEGNAPSPLLPN